MPRHKPYTGPPKLVVAFDIGTTFSAISYCVLELGQVPEVFGVMRFPGQGLVSGDAKVPSLLYYDNDGDLKAAGAEALSDHIVEGAQTKGWTKAEWWKLHLRPKHLASSINVDDDLPPLPPGKSAVDVLADFIKYLFQCAKTYIQNHRRTCVWSTIEDSIEYIFTHPNGWEGIQQQLYRRAIVRAGLVTPEDQSRVHMLTEGEASLHFCVSNLLDAGTANQASPRGIVIIDAGGGTVDLTECRLQGAVFVTRRAKALLERKLEGWKRSSPEDIAEYTREFDRSTKLAIKSDQEPAYVTVGGHRVEDARFNIARGKLRLTGEEATGLINESIDAIIDAFEQQQEFATTPITTAFVVGGLSTNDWLWARVQSYFKARNIDVCRPDNHINKAVAHGAVISHIDRDNHLIASRVARATYGVMCAVLVQPNNEEHVRRKHQWEFDPTGDCFIPGYFHARLLRGTRIREEMEFTESFSRTEDSPIDFGVQTLHLKCYRGTSTVPKWVDEDQSPFYSFCMIHTNFSAAVEDLVMKQTIAGRTYYQLDYDVIVQFGLTELRAQYAWRAKGGGLKRIQAEVAYDV